MNPEDDSLETAAWADYLAAAQRLDAVRRGAATAAGSQAQAVQAAHEELVDVRARLVPQQSRLLELGVPEEALRPSPAEVAAAKAGLVTGPDTVLAALRQARSSSGIAHAAIAGGDSNRPLAMIGRPAWLRNLLVYGPFALVVLIVQLALYLAVHAGSLPPAALISGLALPAVAFGLSWVMIGLVFAAGPDGRVERTSGFGVVVSAAPIVIAGLAAAVLWLMR